MEITRPLSLAKKHELKLPKDYHCACRYCKQFLGELIRPDGANYSRLDRRAYYSREEIAAVNANAGHIAKTPLHIARWAVQRYTKPGNWVLDPTVGAGTTVVEALTHGRNAVGVEIQFIDVAKANVEHVLADKDVCPHAPHHALIHGDARNIDKHLGIIEAPRFDLVVNNPPYWGDQSQKAIGGKMYDYDPSRKNLAFLKEGPEYWTTMAQIYGACAGRLKKGGHFVVGIKDQMRNKAPDMLHKSFAEMMEGTLGLAFVGVALLRHHPTTLFINTYEKNHGVPPPRFQTILVFRKV